jgi:hypothetical protein
LQQAPGQVGLYDDDDDEDVDDDGFVTTSTTSAEKQGSDEVVPNLDVTLMVLLSKTSTIQ